MYLQLWTTDVSMFIMIILAQQDERCPSVVWMNMVNANDTTIYVLLFLPQLFHVPRLNVVSEVFTLLSELSQYAHSAPIVLLKFDVNLFEFDVNLFQSEQWIEEEKVSILTKPSPLSSNDSLQ